ncbi:MAG: hypothetical protein FJ255_10570 [Phycisphaerae bacterium]|nr:hypothetical protein [Phycisphaerae bacterium]
MTSWEIATVAAASTPALAGAVAALRHASARRPRLPASFEANGLRGERAGGGAALNPTAHIAVFGGTPRTHARTARGAFRGMPLAAVAYHEQDGPRAAVTAFTASRTPAPPGWPDVAIDPAVMPTRRPPAADPFPVESPDPAWARSAISPDLLEFLRRSCRPILWWRGGAGSVACVVPGHEHRVATAEGVWGAPRGFRSLMDRPPRPAPGAHV